MSNKYLTRPEEILLLAVWRLKDEAYGISIRRLVRELTGKYWSIGAIYVPLERLERKGFVRSFTTAPAPERGGRKKRVFVITDEGLRQLEEIKRVTRAIWAGYPGIAFEEE